VTTTALLLLLSAALIVAGVALVWSDVYRKGREAFLVRADPTGAHPQAEVTLAPPAPEPELAFPDDSPPAEVGHPPETAAQWAAGTPAQWAALQPAITAAIEQVNAVLTGAGVAVGAAGKPSWSMLGRGYGVYHRLLVGGESLAWLRLELATSGQLQASVKAHKDDFAAINATSAVPAHGLDIARASDLLSECLKPAASFAVRAANGVDTEQWTSETAWKAIDPVVTAALQAANGALAQAGARFIPLGAPTWLADLRRHGLGIAVEVSNTEVARMRIERIAEEIEVAVAMPEPRLADLGRRQRIPVRGLTTHALAELIAACTWPAIAHFREMQHLA
jgi:hypothetical protein